MMHTARQAAATVVEEARCFLHARLPLGISLAALVLTVSLVALSVLSESSLSNSAAVMAGSQFSLLAGIAVILFIPADLVTGGHIFLVEMDRLRVLVSRVLAVVIVCATLGFVTVSAAAVLASWLVGAPFPTALSLVAAVAIVVLTVLTSAGIGMISSSRALSVLVFLVLPVALATLLRLAFGGAASYGSFNYCFEQLALGMVGREFALATVIGSVSWAILPLAIGFIIAQRRSL